MNQTKLKFVTAIAKKYSLSTRMSSDGHIMLYDGALFISKANVSSQDGSEQRFKKHFERGIAKKLAART